MGVTLHFHGTPITPMTALYELAGRCFCVSYERPDQVALVHGIEQSVMLDNGAFSAWRRGAVTDWNGYYAWADQWLDYPTTWAVIPDVIDAVAEVQDALLRQWPHGHRGAPVWHMHEPVERLLMLLDGWPRVCIGSSAQFAVVGSEAWHRRMAAAMNAIAARHARIPWLHMLRGMSLAGSDYPFASLDSTDVARNHNRPQNTPRKMADRWDGAQCPGRWVQQPMQADLLEVLNA